MTLAPIRVLIAEDQALVRGALIALLALESDIAIVAQASDGLDAAIKVRQLNPDILLADVEMPGMTGIELANKITAEKLSTKVVIVSTFARPGYLARARAAGALGYLPKSAPAEELARAIRTVHAGGRAIAPQLAQAAREAGLDPLTSRERDVLRLAEKGLSNKEIADGLSLSLGTVRNYLADAAAKLGAANRTEAGRLARGMGWL